MELLILADDLTGALDSGVQLAKAGLNTLVVHEPSYDILRERPDTQVLVIDTETRHETAEHAYRKVYEVARRAYDEGFRLIYKKNDSTLRGNIGSELAALMDATNNGRLFFAPAFPLLNRITVNGIQYADGVPLDRTVYARDPLNPVTKSNVADMIAEQTDIAAISTSLENLSAAIENAPGRAIFVIDADSNEELSETGRFLAGRKNLLLAGSSGFSAALPDILGKRRPEREYPLSPQKTFVLCGSLNAYSLEQVRHAADRGVPLFSLAPEQLQRGYAHSAAGSRFRQSLARVLAEKGCAILQTGTDITDTKADDCLDVAKHIGRLAAEVAADTALDMMVVFGGDTLLGVVSSLRGAVVIPQCEVLPGVVQSSLIWKDGRTALVSKAGGFGGPDTLTRLLDHYHVRE